MTKKDVVTTSPVPMPMELIEKAVAAGNVESLERLMALQERWEASNARKAYMYAMAAFQGECPGIAKRGEVKDRDAKHMYSYVFLEDILAVVTPIMSKHGLSLTFDTKQTENDLQVSTNVRHTDGHVETTLFTVPVPKIMNANSTQNMGAANSYARRYGVINALNLRIAGEDTDGRYLGEREETINPKQAAEMKEAIDELGANIDMAKFLRLANAESVLDVKAHDYNDLMLRLKKKAAQVKAAASKARSSGE